MQEHSRVTRTVQCYATATGVSQRYSAYRMLGKVQQTASIRTAVCGTLTALPPVSKSSCSSSSGYCTAAIRDTV
eukprot:18690-Heterococcus_DN1.PRE.2